MAAGDPPAAKRSILKEIRLQRENVFQAEPGESLPWVYQLANRFHGRTRPYVIRNEILLKEGEPVDSLIFAESIRLLRERSLFQVVEGHLESADSGMVAHIHTQDYWSLALQAGYSQEGGLRSVLLGVFDSNFAGTGNTLSAGQRWSTDQDQTRLALWAPRFFGRRENMAVEFRETSDGQVWGGYFGHTYDNFLEPWSYGLSGFRFKGRYRLYEDDREVLRFSMREKMGQVHVENYTGRNVQIGGGAGFLYYDFEPDTLITLRMTDRMIDDPVGEKYRMIFLTAGLQKRRFIQTRNLNRYGVIEDVPLGFSTRAILGRNLHPFGADDRRRHAELQFAGAVHPLMRWWAHIFVWSSLEWGGDLPNRRRMNVQSLLMRRHATQSLTALQVRVRWGKHLPSEERVYRGGGNGLRGYPSRALAGTGYLVLNLEHRYWTAMHLQFFHLGFSVFADAAWVGDDLDGLRDAEWKPAAGLGLMIGNPKSASGVLRVEFAARLDDSRAWDLGISSSRLLYLVPVLDLAQPVLDIFDHRP